MRKLLGLLVVLGISFSLKGQSCETGNLNVSKSSIKYTSVYHEFYQSWNGTTWNKYLGTSATNPTDIKLGDNDRDEFRSTLLSTYDFNYQSQFEIPLGSIRNEQIKSVRLKLKIKKVAGFEKRDYGIYDILTERNSGSGKYSVWVRNPKCSYYSGNKQLTYDCLRLINAGVANHVEERTIASSAGNYETHVINFSPENLEFMDQNATSFFIQVAAKSEDISSAVGYLEIADISAEISYKKDPTVNFTASETTIAAGASIDFTDQSTSCPNAWQWTFAGAETSNSFIQNPTGIKYNTPGRYSVTLKAKNASVFKTKTKTNYITVTEGVKADAGDDKTICKNASVILNGNASFGTAPYTYKWKNGSTVIGTSFSKSISSVPSTTTYELEVTDANDVKSSDFITITTQQPSVDAGSDIKVCENLDFQLNAIGSSGVTYSWSPGLGLNPGSGSTKDPIGNLPSSQTYTVTVTDGLGCNASDAVNVIVSNVYPSADAGIDRTICSEESTSLGGSPTGSGASGDYTYSWSSPSGFSSLDDNPTATVTSTEVFTVTVTDANGCSTDDEVLVSTTALPVVDAGSDVVVCFSGTETLGGSPAATSSFGPLSYDWTPIDNLSDPSISNPEASPSNTTLYTLTVTDANGCSASDDVTFEVSKPQVNIIGDKDVCFDTPIGVQLANESTGGVPTYSYSWTPTTGLSDPLTFDALALPSVNTTYTLTVTDAAGCSANESVNVTVNSDKPVVDAGTDIIKCEDELVNLSGTATGGTGVYSVLWTPSTGLSSVSSLNTNANAANNVTYTLKVTDANGCVSTDDLTVDVFNKIEVEIPLVKACPLNSPQIIPNVISGDSPFTWKWSDNNITVIGDASAPFATLKSSEIPESNESVLVTDANGCSKSIDFIVQNTGYEFGVTDRETVCGEVDGINPDVVVYEEIETGVSSSCLEGTTINPDASIVFEAGYKITLSPGFSALRESNFRAHIKSQCSPYGLGEEEPLEPSFGIQIYPNPSVGMVNLKLSGSDVDLKNSKVNVFNISGGLVLSENLVRNEYNYQFDLTSVESGLYFVVVTIDGKSETQRISIIK